MDLKTLLEKQTRLSLNDGRILQGSLVCVDRQENFVIDQATGYKSGGLEIPQMLLVPGKFVHKIEILDD